MNPYFKNLNLPIKFIPKKIDFSIKQHLIYSGAEVNDEMKSFLNSLNLKPHFVEVFYSSTNCELSTIHIDGSKKSNIVKINYVYDNGSSKLKWFKLKKGKKLNVKKTALGTDFLSVNNNDVNEVCEHKFKGPCLCNVGQLHAVSNIVSPMTYYGIALITLENKRLEWKEAINIFKNYI